VSVDYDRTSGRAVPIRAAGGLLWRETARGLRLAIVHRSRYDDWALPKGKLKPGESWLKAAVREVQEETGCEPQVLGFAGAVAYDTTRGPKIVRFWNMKPRGLVQAGVDQTEIISVTWLSPTKAMRQLSYPLEKLIVETWHKQIRPFRLWQTPACWHLKVMVVPPAMRRGARLILQR